MAFCKNRKAFSLTEVLIALIIVAIVGGAATLGLSFAFSSFSQIEDYIAAEREIEQAVQMLSREFALIGLGMPNNREGLGSFAWSFRGATGLIPMMPPQPITASFGPLHGTPPQNPAVELRNRQWLTGGPVTLAMFDENDPHNDTNIQPLAICGCAECLNSNRIRFHGRQLFYAFGIPTGVMARITGANEATYNTQLTLELFGRRDMSDNYISGASILQNFRWGGRNIGLQVPGNAANLRSWVLLPTLLIPTLANTFDAANPNILNVTAAPMVGDVAALPPKQRTVMGVDEIHLLQAGRVYLDPNTNELRRVLFQAPHAPGERFPRDVLARNIVGLHFTFSPEDRVLTMYIAAQGVHRSRVRGDAAVWPWGDFFNPINSDRRVVVRSVSWRIRN